MRIGIVITGAILIAVGVWLYFFFWFACTISTILLLIGILLVVIGVAIPEEKKSGYSGGYSEDNRRYWFTRIWNEISRIGEEQRRILNELEDIEELQRKTIERVYDIEQRIGIPSEKLPELEEVPQPYRPEIPEEPLEEVVVAEEMEEALEIHEEPSGEVFDKMAAIEELRESRAPEPERPIEGMSRMEMALGEKWFQRLGLILLAVAFVLILAIAVPRLSPIQIVGLDFAVAIGIALLGEFVYMKQRLRNYAKGLEVGAFAIGHIGVWGGGFFYQIPGFPWHYLLSALIALQVVAAFRYASPLLAIQMGLLHLGWTVWLRHLQSIDALTFVVLLSVGAILAILVAFGLRNALAVIFLAFSFDSVALLTFSLAVPYAYLPVLVVGLATIVVVTLLRWERVELPIPEIRIVAWAAGIIFTYGILLTNIQVIDDVTVLLTLGTLTAVLVSAEILAPDDELTLAFALMLGILTFPVAFLMERGEFALVLYPMVLAVLGVLRPVKGLAWMPTIVYVSLAAFAAYPNLIDPGVQMTGVWVLLFATFAIHVFLQDRAGYGLPSEDAPVDFYVPFVVLALTYLTPAALPVPAREVLYLLAMPLSFVLMRKTQNSLFIALIMALATFSPPLFLARGELAVPLFPAMLLALHTWRPTEGYAWFAYPIYLSAVAFALIPSQPDVMTRLAIAWGLFFVTIVLHSYLQWKSGYTEVPGEFPTDLQAMPLAVVLVGLTAAKIGSDGLAFVPLAIHIVAFPLTILLNRRAILGPPLSMTLVIAVAAGSMFLSRIWALVLGGSFSLPLEWTAASFHLAIMLALSALVVMTKPTDEFTLYIPTETRLHYSLPTFALLAGLLSQTFDTTMLFVVLPVVIAVIAFYLDDAITFNTAYFAIVGQCFIAVYTFTSDLGIAILVLPLLLAPMIVLGFLFELGTKKLNLARLTQLLSVIIWFIGPPLAFGAGVQTTISWTIIGAVALAWGLSRKFPALRYLGFLLVFSVLGKVFVYDIAGLDPELRLLGVILLAVALLAISYGYARYRKRLAVRA